MVTEILIKAQKFHREDKGAVVSWGRTETVQEIPMAPNEKIPVITRRTKFSFRWHFRSVGGKQTITKMISDHYEY